VLADAKLLLVPVPLHELRRHPNHIGHPHPDVSLDGALWERRALGPLTRELARQETLNEGMPKSRRAHFDGALLVELDFARDRSHDTIVGELPPALAQLRARQALGGPVSVPWRSWGSSEKRRLDCARRRRARATRESGGFAEETRNAPARSITIPSTRP